ncbi:(Na+)-NQR maturation NqrM [compost metagenome]
MTFVLVFAIMLLVVLGMAVGVIMGRKPIAGSCGGIANLGIEKECSICGGNREKCEEVRREGDVVESSLAYDATKR